MLLAVIYRIVEGSIIYFMINISISTQNNQIFQVIKYMKYMIIMIAYSSNIDNTVVFLREHELRVGTIISLYY